MPIRTLNIWSFMHQDMVGTRGLLFWRRLESIKDLSDTRMITCQLMWCGVKFSTYVDHKTIYPGEVEQVLKSSVEDSSSTRRCDIFDTFGSDLNIPFLKSFLKWGNFLGYWTMSAVFLSQVAGGYWTSPVQRTCV